MTKGVSQESRGPFPQHQRSCDAFVQGVDSNVRHGNHKHTTHTCTHAHTVHPFIYHKQMHTNITGSLSFFTPPTPPPPSSFSLSLSISISLAPSVSLHTIILN